VVKQNAIATSVVVASAAAFEAAALFLINPKLTAASNIGHLLGVALAWDRTRYR
jgi:hypothetical protein